MTPTLGSKVSTTGLKLKLTVSVFVYFCTKKTRIADTEKQNIQNISWGESYQESRGLTIAGSDGLFSCRSSVLGLRLPRAFGPPVSLPGSGVGRTGALPPRYPSTSFQSRTLLLRSNPSS